VLHTLRISFSLTWSFWFCLVQDAVREAPPYTVF
jgi:hypothetical protein